ncbi:MAG: hypothetical protein EBU08_14445 [Micrococcales bacterium]|nr:hypothetical protein [Micrococcales bacterium]
MALLDYLFPPQQSQVGGLLGVDEEKMRQAAQRAGLLNTGLGIIAASGPSRMPQGILQPVATGLISGQQAYQSAINQQIQDALAARKAQEEKSVILPEGATMVGERTGQVKAQGAPKTPGIIAEYTTARDLGLIPPNTTLTDYVTMKTPKTVLDMTGGQKGFENELKLGGAFKGEPVYKAFSEMKSAYGQITDSLKQTSPAGDLAAATKFMKLLDPGSVVRESELAMAMAASGALDRATNYAQNVIKGTKLTPTQRADFQLLADKLYGTAASTYNDKRGEYIQQGEEYGLNATRAVGAPAKLPETEKKRKVYNPNTGRVE